MKISNISLQYNSYI